MVFVGLFLLLFLQLLHIALDKIPYLLQFMGVILSYSLVKVANSCGGSWSLVLVKQHLWFISLLSKE
jgi:hypothetical protein